MGMNLNINRIIFSAIEKSIRGERCLLETFDVRQIAGRAGRFNKDGYVNSFSNKNL